MTFDDAASPADQEFNLIQDFNGVTEYATKYLIINRFLRLIIQLFIYCLLLQDCDIFFCVSFNASFSEKLWRRHVPNLLYWTER